MKDQNQKFGASTQTFSNIEKLLQPDCYTVFTGQQIGLFGGPLYTLYKSLTAIKLAEKLSEDLKIKVVPVFWMATDDHDFDEISHCYFIDKQNKLVKLEYKPHKAWHGFPASQIVLDENVNQAFEILASASKEAGYSGEVKQKLKEFYLPGQHYYQAFAHWLNRLLGKFGLVILNPADIRFKTLLKPVFQAELQKNGNLQSLIEETSQRIEGLNYHRQVHKKPGLTNLFYHTPRRMHITKQNGRFCWDGSDQSVSSLDLEKLIDSAPQNFSANVLLRPLLESFLFPNLAHVAGPSEIAYFAQIKSLHQELGVTMPVVYPRKSFTLVEPETKKILDQHKISPQDVMQNVEQVYNRIIQEKIPADAEKKLERTQDELKQKVLDLGLEILRIQPGLKQNLEFTQTKIDFEFNKFKEKFFQAYKKQFKQIKDELYQVRDFIYPEGTFQERIFNSAYFTSRYGYEFADFLYRNLDLDSFDHTILEVDER